MTELNDHDLLAEFARSGSEVAFATLTARHVNLVYSAALRFCGDAQHCEEITQAVFIILARKAGKLSPRVVLSGWLYQTARLTAANLVKGEIRRQRREQEAYMQSTLNETDLSRQSGAAADAAAWQQLAPLLDEAMGRLGETDRNAVVLRFFENKTAAEVAAALKLTEAAAHKRVNRALEKLRKMFSKRGVALSATLIAGAVSASSVQAAPVGLAATISTVALTKGAAAGGSTLTLVKGALKIMAWTKAKTAVVAAAVVVLAAGTTTPIIIHHYKAKAEQVMASLFTSKTELTDADNADYQQQTGTTPAAKAQAFFDACSRQDWNTVGKFWPTPLDDRIKGYLGGMEVVSLGKPFKARISIAALLELQPNLRSQLKGMGDQKDFQGPQVYVPYEIRLKDGNVKKWQLSIRCDNPEHRWYFDGGL